MSSRTRRQANFSSRPEKGKKQRRTQHVKGGMHHRNPQLVDGVADKVEVHHCVDEVENRQPHAGTNDVEQQVHHSSPLGVLVGPYREIMAVTQVPMFCPMMMGMAAP